MPIKIEGFEHIHQHSNYSLLDGFAKIEEYAERAVKINQKFICITDHGMLGGVPNQIQCCEQYGLSPIFGCELYYQPKQPEIKDGENTGDHYAKFLNENERKELRKSFHLLAIAYNSTGYKNLVKLTSWGWLHGFYYKPRINYEMLMSHKEGLLFTSGCYLSEIGQAFDRGGEDEGMSMVEKYIGMFGDKFRLSIMLLDFKKQKPYDAFILKAAHKYNIPLVLENDCHYCNQEDSKYQRLMLMVRAKKTIQEVEAEQAKAEMDETVADVFELQDTNLWMKSEEEINEKWEKDYSDIIEYGAFQQAKANSVAICNMARGVVLDRSIKLPEIPDADAKFKEAIIEGIKKRGIKQNQEYLDRIKEEYNLICHKGFSSYFLIKKMFVDEARRYWAAKYGGTGAEAVGPGRGSAPGALVSYALGITDVDPIPHGLLFSRFLSPSRGGKQMKLRFSIPPK